MMTEAGIWAASEVWFAFSAWLRILEDAEGGLWAGRELTLGDAREREAAVAAIEGTPWRDELSEYLEAFDKASDFVGTWTTVGEVPRGTGGAYLRVAVKDARLALEQLTAFLFTRLRSTVKESGA